MKRVRILVIDDDWSEAVDILEGLKKCFPDNEIDSAYFKADALKFLRNKEYDLITLDGKLDGDNHGREVLARMSLEQVTKTIIYSNDGDFLYECSEKGIETFLKSARFSKVVEYSVLIKNLLGNNRKE